MRIMVLTVVSQFQSCNTFLKHISSWVPTTTVLIKKLRGDGMEGEGEGEGERERG